MTGSPETGSYCIFPYAKLYRVRGVFGLELLDWNSLDNELKQLPLPMSKQSSSIYRSGVFVVETISLIDKLVFIQ